MARKYIMWIKWKNANANGLKKAKEDERLDVDQGVLDDAHNFNSLFSGQRYFTTNPALPENPARIISRGFMVLAGLAFSEYFACCEATDLG